MWHIFISLWKTKCVSFPCQTHIHSDGRVIGFSRMTRQLPGLLIQPSPQAHCVLEGPTQQTQNICITFIQSWTSVEDVAPMLFKCYINVLRLLGIHVQGVQALFCRPKPKGSICLLVKQADTAFKLCQGSNRAFIYTQIIAVSQNKVEMGMW